MMIPPKTNSMRLFLIATTLLLLSCGGEMRQEDLLPDSNGAHGEVLVIMDENLWAGDLGELVISKLTQRCTGPYLRPEPQFSYLWTDPDGLNHRLQRNRTILKLMVDHDSTYTTTQIVKKYDYYAKNQLFLIVKHSDLNELYQFVLDDWQMLADEINTFEKESYRKQYVEQPNDRIKELAEKKFGLSISLPKETKLYDERDSFVWAKRERSHNIIGSEANGTHSETYWIMQGILIWSTPYVSDNQLTVDSLLKIRDTTLKYNVPGKYPGSYMATEYDPYYKPEGRKFEYHGQNAVEIRGLWKHAGERGAFGGGPFVQYSIHNPTEGTIVTVSCYIYGPKFDKREYIREADAMLNTIELL